ncbi:MAG: glycerate kinase [Pigmentiphaga sp.]|nr:glycerate kinase [Pigmentiphaga sp.]
MKQSAKEIFLVGVASVLPDKLIRSQIKLTGDKLQVQHYTYDLNTFKNIFVIGAGKASALMASAIESILGNRITSGHIITKYDHGVELKHIKLSEAGHPVPDQNGLHATSAIIKIAHQAEKDDLVICLISGGASALLIDTPPGIPLEDIVVVNEILLKSGADIREVNIIRKHLSKVKGGQLAKVVFPATILSLILSDVVGDPMDVIASGPTVPDTSSFMDVTGIIKKYELEKRLPQSIIKHIVRGAAGIVTENPKPDDLCFINTNNIIIGSNQTALEAASNEAVEKKFDTHIITNSLQGDYLQVANFILKTIEQYVRQQGKQPVCLLFGGEPTVQVRGNGLGGRNQHLALYLATKIKGKRDITIVCAGTDGTDGPTDVAGAVVDNYTISKALSLDIDPHLYLENADSYAFFNQVGGHIKIGSTQTNVMDLVITLMY